MTDDDGEYVSAALSSSNKTKRHSRSALHVAIAHSSNYNISRLLIEKGADITNSSIDGSTPFHTFFNAVVGKLALRYGKDMDVSVKDCRGRTACHYLAWSNESTIGDAKAYSVDGTCLMSQDDEGRSPLHYAARRGNMELAKYFLKLVPSHAVHQADHHGKTAFHYAMESKRVAILDILQSGGIDIGRKDGQGRSVLHQAALHHNVEAVKRVIAIAGVIGQQLMIEKDISGKTPFQLAREHGAMSVVEYFQAAHGLSCSDADAVIEIRASKRPWWHEWYCDGRATVAAAAGGGTKVVYPLGIFVLCVLIIMYT